MVVYLPGRTGRKPLDFSSDPSCEHQTRVLLPNGPFVMPGHAPFPFLLCLPQAAVSRNAAPCLLKAEIIHWVVKKNDDSGH